MFPFWFWICSRSKHSLNLSSSIGYPKSWCMKGKALSDIFKVLELNYTNGLDWIHSLLKTKKTKKIYFSSHEGKGALNVRLYSFQKRASTVKHARFSLVTFDS